MWLLILVDIDHSTAANFVVVGDTHIPGCFCLRSSIIILLVPTARTSKSL